MSLSIEERRLEPLIEIVRSADRERYVAALYAPEERRGDLLALYAFDAEIAGVRSRVSQALPGEIRLQWWRDVIDADDVDAGAGYPVAEALLAAIRRNALPRRAFQDYLDARIFDLYDDAMPTRGDLEGYCGETTAALLQLSTLVLDPQSGSATAELSGHAGCAIAIAGLLRLLSVHRRRGQCYVPKDILSAAGSSPEEFVAGEGGPNAPRAVSAMIALAHEHLAAFEREAGRLPESLRPAFLPAASVRALLARMTGREKELLTSTVDISLWRKQWLMFRRASGGWR